MLVTFDSRSRKKRNESQGGSQIRPKTVVPPSAKVSKPEAKPTNSPKSAHENVPIDGVRHIDTVTDLLDFNTIKRSKHGCLTCKIRKKKCNEARPICSNCGRLNKQCIWIDYEKMSAEEIKNLKESVEEDEKNLKLRRRRPQKEVSEAKTISTKTQDPSKRPITRVAKFSIGSPMSAMNSSELSPKQPLERPSLNDLPPQPLGSLLTSHIKALSPILSLLNEMEPPAVPISENALSPLLLLLGLYKEPSLTEVRDILKHSSSPSIFASFLKEFSQFSSGHSGDVVHHNSIEENDYDAASNLSSFFEHFSTQHGLSPVNSLVTLSQFASFISPSPEAPIPLLPQLSSTGAYLYNYYTDILSSKMAITPLALNDTNSFQNVFLPLAQRDNGVLYGILVWSAFHLGGEWLKEGQVYLDLCLGHISKSLTNLKQKQDAGLPTPDSLKQNRQLVVNYLAALLILCGAEICRGDVRDWSIYLSWGWKIMTSNGGILNFNQTKEEYWLISNFAYHDLLSGSVVDRGTYFSADTYDEIFEDRDKVSRGQIHALLGVSKKLYKCIGEINTLVGKSNKVLSYLSAPRPLETVQEFGTGRVNADENSSLDKRSSLLQSILHRAAEIEQEIDGAKPDAEDLRRLCDEDLEVQLMLFEANQLTCKLFLHQSIYRINPSCLQSQMLTNHLIKCIDILLASSVVCSLVFPVFIAGIHLIHTLDREIMTKRLQHYMKVYGPWNVRVVKIVMERVWEENPDGNKVVDWHNIVKELGWDINFA